MEKNLGFVMLKELLSQMASSFPGQHLSEEEWGIHWQRSSESDVIITKKLDDQVRKYVERLPGTKHTFVLDDNEDNNGLQLWFREYKKVRLPFLEEFIFESFSFNDRRRAAVEYYSYLETLPEFCDVGEDEVKGFDQLARGILHIGKNARLWLIQDPSSIPVSMAITTEFEGIEKSTCIFIFGTHHNLRNRGFGRSLIEFILSQTKKGTRTHLLTYGGRPSPKFCRSLGFSLELNFRKL